MERISGFPGLWGIPFPNRSGLLRVQARQQPAQLLAGDLSGFSARARPLWAAVSVALMEKAETVPFMADCPDPVCPFPAEEEQGIAVRIRPEAVLYDTGQTIRLFPHIRVPGAQTDPVCPGEVT